MAEVIARAVFYGLVAAASPLAFASTVVVLRSHRARLNGVMFATAFVLAGLAIVLLALAIGAGAAPGAGGSSTAAAGLELALGVLLLVAAMRIRRLPPASTDDASRTQALLDRLALITPKTAFPAGALLGIGGPKRLTIGIVTATTISAADMTRSSSVVVAVLYVVVATVLVWAPVALYVVAGPRTRAWLAQAEAWLLENERLFGVVSLLVFGALLATDGLARLV